MQLRMMFINQVFNRLNFNDNFLITDTESSSAHFSLFA